MEESEFAISSENVKKNFEEKAAKRLKISKNSWEAEEIKQDSMAFLYNKFKDQLDAQSETSDNNEDYPLSLNPFELITNNPPQELENKIKNTVEEGKILNKSSKTPPFNISIKEDANVYTAREKNLKLSGKRYSNFRQDSQGILTIDELWDDNKSTPTKEERYSQLEKAQEDHSNLTFNTVSIHKSDNNGVVSLKFEIFRVKRTMKFWIFLQ